MGKAIWTRIGMMALATVLGVATVHTAQAAESGKAAATDAAKSMPKKSKKHAHKHKSGATAPADAAAGSK